MLHLVRLSAVLLWVINSSSVCAAAEYDGTLESTVLITAPLGKVAAYASGVIVADRQTLVVLTAAHVAQLGNLTVITSLGERLAVRATRIISGRDLALVETERASYRYTTPELAPADQVRQDMHLWGFPRSNAPTRSDASILSLQPAIPDGNPNGRFTIECPSCDHGDSGAGVFTSDGRLVGILTSAWKNAQGVVLMIVVEPAVAAMGALGVSVTTASR